MTDITLTDEELGLIKRVLSFATHDVPITDALGNKIFPTTYTRALALDLENRLEEAGVPTPGKLFTAYDPAALVDKVATLRWFADGDVEYNVKGKIAKVQAHEDEEPTAYTITLVDGTEHRYLSRDELQANSRVELEQG